MNKAYNRINDGKGWENYPSDKTPLNKYNLDKSDVALDEIDNRVITLDTTKATKVEVSTLIKEIEFNESNGIFTITRKNGSKFTIDTKLEKIAVNFTYNSTTQQIILTLIDGTKQYIDLSALITQYEFLDTDTVSFFVDTNGKVSAIVKDGSITEDKLQPNYLAEIKVEVAKAEAAAAAADASEKAAKSSEDAAKASKIAAKASEDNAADSAADAAASEAIATQKANDAASSAETATQKATAAGNSASSAATSAANADNSKNAAAASEANAAESATSADTYAKQAQSYAIGTGGVRPNEAIDSAKYYYEQSKEISEGLSGTLQAMGTVTFANLPLLADVGSGWMYNVSDEFVTDSTFKEGAGHTIAAGANVYKTSDGFWDVLAGNFVAKVNGKTGNVTLTAEDIGAIGNQISIANNTDLNSLTEDGLYYKIGGVSVTNKPSGVYDSMGFGLLVFRSGGSVIGQLLFATAMNLSLYSRARRSNNDTDWSNWERFDKAANDDAYVKKTGDTMTGNLVIQNALAMIKGNAKGYQAYNTDGSKHIWFGFGSDGVTRGLFDSVLNKFIAALNNENTFNINTKLIVNALAEFKQPTLQGSYPGTSGTVGWVVVAQLKLLTSYINHTIEFEIGGRGRALTTILSILFASENNADPALGSFYCYGDPNGSSICRLKKTAASTWQLAVRKNEAYGSVQIFRVNTMLNGSNGLSITYPGTQLSTDPDSTWTAPTYGGLIGAANRLYTKRAINGRNFDGTEAINFYADCTTAAATAAKVATCPGYVLTNGSFLLVHFSNANTAANPTLNVNNTGAKPIGFQSGTVPLNGEIPAGHYLMRYNGSSWLIMDTAVELINHGGTFKKNVTINGTLTLAKTTDLSGTADNLPALVIGTRTAEHLEFDGNEIHAKANGTAASSLNLNLDGGRVIVGPGGVSVRNGNYSIERAGKEQPIIIAHDDGASANNGLELVVRSGGNLFIGSGEAPENLRAKLLAGGQPEGWSKTTENTYIAADASIFIDTNVNDMEHRASAIMHWINESNIYMFVFSPVTSKKGMLGDPNRRWARAYVERIVTALTTGTYLQGNQGGAIINSEAAAGSYTMLAKMNTTNGVMTLGTYTNKFELHYTDKATIDAGVNSVTKTAVLLDEVGNAKFPGTVEAGLFNGLASLAIRSIFIDVNSSDNGVYGFALCEGLAADKSGRLRKPITGSGMGYIASINAIKVGDGSSGRMGWGASSYGTTDTAKPNILFAHYGDSNWAGMGVSNDNNLHVRIGTTEDTASMFTFMFDLDIPRIQFTSLKAGWYASYGAGSGYKAIILSFGLEMLNFARNAYSPIKASAFNVSSSVRYKENIKNLTEEEARKILQIRPVSFDYKEEFGGTKEQFGVIAEETEEYIPFTVTKDAEGRPDAVDYSKFTAHLIKMEQIHETEIQKLKEENAILRAELTELRAAVQTLLSK